MIDVLREVGPWLCIIAGVFITILGGLLVAQGIWEWRQRRKGYG